MTPAAGRAAPVGTGGPVGAVPTVHADLTLEVDGHPVTITADGHDVLVQVSEPGHLVDVLTGIPRPVGTPRGLTRSTLRRVADTGAEHGLTLTVAGPDGVLIAVGAGATSSRWLRLVVGTRNVTFGSRPLLWAAVRPSLVPALRRARSATVRRLAQRFPGRGRG